MRNRTNYANSLRAFEHSDEFATTVNSSGQLNPSKGRIMNIKKFVNMIAATAIFMVTSSASLFAQVKVGNNPTTINAGSVLEMESTNKGMLLPRVALTGTNVWGLAGTAAAGMVVYNTTDAGSGVNAVAANTMYMWDGNAWVRIVKNTDNNATPTTPFAVGETRTCRMVVPLTVWGGNSQTITMMTGKSVSNTTTNTRTPAFVNATNSPVAVIINGLRLDFIRFSASTSCSPKLYNTTSNAITYTLASISTVQAYINGAGTTIAGNAYSDKIDGDDNFGASNNDLAEYVNAMITFPDGQWYNCTWHATEDANNIYLYVSALRLN